VGGADQLHDVLTFQLFRLDFRGAFPSGLRVGPMKFTKPCAVYLVGRGRKNKQAHLQISTLQFTTPTPWLRHFPILWHIKRERIFLTAGLYAEIGSVGYHNMVKRVLVGYGIDVDAVSGWCVLRTISSMQQGR
jgi:hypothetical protein